MTQFHVPTWADIAGLLGFVILLTLLVPWPPIRKVWAVALHAALYVSLVATVAMGYVYALRVATEPVALAAAVDPLADTAVQMTGVDRTRIRPWILLTITGCAVVLRVSALQIVSCGRRVVRYNGFLRCLTASNEQLADGTASLAIRPPVDDIEIAGKGVRNLVQGSSGSKRQSLAKWLKT